MVNNIASLHTVLKLNKNWAEIGTSCIGKSIVDLVTGVVCALDINWELDEEGMPINNKKPIYINPVDWEEWIKLPVRPWDLSLRSMKMHIRAPTVVITKNYKKMPTKRPQKFPSNIAVQVRDGNICQYTGRMLKPGEGSVDHVIPVSRGGQNTWDNVVWADKKINSDKGKHLNEEIGLSLIQPPRKPRQIEIWETIRKPMHPDWVPFMRTLQRRSD